MADRQPVTNAAGQDSVLPCLYSASLPLHSFRIRPDAPASFHDKSEDKAECPGEVGYRSVAVEVIPEREAESEIHANIVRNIEQLPLCTGTEGIGDENIVCHIRGQQRDLGVAGQQQIAAKTRPDTDIEV